MLDAPCYGISRWSPLTFMSLCGVCAASDVRGCRFAAHGTDRFRLGRCKRQEGMAGGSIRRCSLCLDHEIGLLARCVHTAHFHHRNLGANRSENARSESDPRRRGLVHAPISVGRSSRLHHMSGSGRAAHAPWRAEPMRDMRCPVQPGMRLSEHARVTWHEICLLASESCRG